MRLFFFLLATTAWADLTGISPSSMTFSQAYQHSPDWGQAITLSGSGSWSLVESGTCAGDMAPSASSGTLPQTIYVYPVTSINTAVQASTCTFTFSGGAGSFPLSITLNIVRRNAIPPVFIPAAIADGSISDCSNPDSTLYWDEASCSGRNVRPGGTFDLGASAGASVTDPIFGGVIRRESELDETLMYSTVSGANADNTLFMVNAVVGGLAAMHIRAVGTGAMVHSSAPTSCAGCTWWHPTDPNIYYINALDDIIRVDLPSLTQTTIFSYPGGATMQNGNNGMNKDGLWAFDVASEGKICAININNTAQYACAVYTGFPGMSGIDHPKMSKGRDSVTGRYYVISESALTNLVWSWLPGEAALTFEFVMPIAPGNFVATATKDRVCDSPADDSQCLKSSHGDTMEDSDGQQYWVHYDSNVANVTYISYYRLNAGLAMSTAAEVGGGYHHGIFFTTPALGGGHVSCALLAPYCSAYLAEAEGVANNLISGCTNASPIVCTITGAHTLVTSDSVLVSDVAGNTAANGVWTATVSGASLTLQGSTGNGTHTAGTGSVTKNVSPTYSVRHQGELVIIRGPGREVRRLAHHRAVIYTTAQPDNPGDYFSKPFANITFDASRIFFASNGGMMDRTAVHSVATGVSARGREEFTSSRALAVSYTATKGILRYHAPSIAACTYTISANRDLSSPILSATDSGGALGREVTFTSSASTTYYARIVCGNLYSATTEFTTPAAPSGSVTVSIGATVPAGLSADNCIVDYGVTSSLGSTTSPVACTAGAATSLSISATRGDYLYTRLSVRNSGNTVIKDFGVSAIAVP